MNFHLLKFFCTMTLSAKFLRRSVLLLSLMSLCLLIFYAGWSTNRHGQDTRTEGRRGRGDKRQFQFINRVVTSFDKESAAAMLELVARKAPSRDPQLIDVVRRLIDPPPNEGLKMLSKAILETPQSKEVDALLKRKRKGFFVECGAYDGEAFSNSLPFEHKREWTGLLIEVSPFYYTQLLGKNRNVWSLNACLSPYDYATQLQFEVRGGQIGRVKLTDDLKPTSSSGDKNMTRSSSGDKNKTRSSSRDKNKTGLSSGDKNKTGSSSGDKNKTGSSSGNKNKTTSSSGDKNMTRSSSGDKNKTRSSSGDKNMTRSSSGAKNMTRSSSGDKNMTRSSSGDKNMTTNTYLVPCFPLETILLAINQTHIDFFSLDVEGLELEVLKTIPFDRINIRVLTVEYLHGRGGKDAYKSFMKSKGFQIHKDMKIRKADSFVHDFIFVNNGSSRN